MGRRFACDVPTARLRPQGQLLTQYFGIADVGLDNYIAQISGQGPNRNTQGDCITFYGVRRDRVGVTGRCWTTGACTRRVKTIADQLDRQGHTWGRTWRTSADDAAP